MLYKAIDQNFDCGCDRCAIRATGKAGNGKRDGNGNGKRDGNGNRKRERETGNENLREAAGAETARSSIGYCLNQSQGRVGLRTHGSLTLFMSRTTKELWGGGYNNQLDQHASSE